MRPNIRLNFGKKHQLERHYIQIGPYILNWIQLKYINTSWSFSILKAREIRSTAWSSIESTPSLNLFTSLSSLPSSSSIWWDVKNAGGKTAVGGCSFHSLLLCWSRLRWFCGCWALEVVVWANIVTKSIKNVLINKIEKYFYKVKTVVKEKKIFCNPAIGGGSSVRSNKHSLH